MDNVPDAALWIEMHSDIPDVTSLHVTDNLADIILAMDNGW